MSNFLPDRLVFFMHSRPVSDFQRHYKWMNEVEKCLPGMQIKSAFGAHNEHVHMFQHFKSGTTGITADSMPRMPAEYKAHVEACMREAGAPDDVELVISRTLLRVDALNSPQAIVLHEPEHFAVRLRPAKVPAVKLQIGDLVEVTELPEVDVWSGTMRGIVRQFLPAGGFLLDAGEAGCFDISAENEYEVLEFAKPRAKAKTKIKTAE